ncbi:cytosolic endo-beta-N-acetylglucosaminidase-like isoform X2 [Macrosteles quadrilineatus]|uniref:cytosolic endo-beta-N-acetylglucosaminidase-like isoform X2 n=1 Tax=Macrosteles quadrilineatus TaxID=74068 RepID=UPI0023E201C5|nr:cytosolic endo-beta-N-acetylglucosaminidase-like isoform X2 [Macrosteles quadrilineatus]
MDYSSDICYPILDVGSVMQWKCNGNCWIDKYGVSDLCDNTKFVSVGQLLDVREKTTVFPEYKLKQCLVPKTVFCHDFKGGYLEDKFCNGSPDINTYRFFNWSVIDIFIYFSHKLVTIPPHGWLDAGHKHGVPVLGTLITEWGEGENIWNYILSDPEKTSLFSQKLAEICAHFKFDGYLLNVENKVAQDLVAPLVNFVGLLKSHLDLYCKRKTWLLWYDSVTVEGKLDWQNKLCPLNNGLADTLTEAGNRKLDVYVGVDVWGRNCYYDGGFNLDKALGLLRSMNMSVAIFATGWTFEAASPELFIERETSFWNKLSRFLFVHGPANLPFHTNFCQGIVMNGNTPWFQLSAQQYQPSYQPCGTTAGCVSFCEQSCLRVRATSHSHSKLFHRVFVCDFSGNGQDLDVELCLRNSPTEPAKKFQIYFILEDKRGIEGKQGVNMSTTPKGYRSMVELEGLRVVASVMDFTEENLYNESKILSKPTEEKGTWQRVVFTLKMAPSSSLTEILVLPPPSGSVLWGTVGVHVASPSIAELSA